jgi:hypothetical protein
MDSTKTTVAPIGFNLLSEPPEAAIEYASLPAALVLSWSARTLRVKCPFCLSSHRHGHDPKERAGQRRCADCFPVSSGRHYQVIYPDEDCELTSPFGWELDKEEGIIYTVTHEGQLSDPAIARYPPRRLLDKYKRAHDIGDIDASDTEDSEGSIGEDTLAGPMKGLKVSDSGHLRTNPFEPDGSNNAVPKSVQDAYEIVKELYSQESYRHKVYISACCIGDIRDLHMLFERYPDDKYVDVVDQEGNNGILIAATEEAGLNTIKWLECRGVAINKNNHYGRTALMEAALWGRLETVKYLVAKGADINAVDGNGHRAFDLARDLERNEEERISRALHGKAIERADANRRRKQIAAFLALEENTSQISNTASPYEILQGYFQKMLPDTLWFYKPDTSYGLDRNPNKAFARLDRGLKYPVISAMSGYSQGHRKDVVNNEIWTKKAEELCQKIGYKVSPSFASHVEKQLIAYYMDKHWLFSEDTNLEPWEEQEMRDALPSPPPALITVNKLYMCDDCEAFVAAFKKKLDVPIRISCVGDSVNLGGPRF